LKPRKDRKRGRERYPVDLRAAMRKLKGCEVEIIIGAGEAHAVRGVLTYVGLDYVLITQPGNLAYVYPEDITILNVRGDINGKGKRPVHEPEIS